MSRAKTPHLTHIIDRSDLDEVVAIRFDGDKRIEVTRRESLIEATMPRADIVLINCTRNNREYVLYARKEGFAGDLWILDILTDEQHEQVQAIAARMRKNAEEFAPAWKLI